MNEKRYLEELVKPLRLPAYLEHVTYELECLALKLKDKRLVNTDWFGDLGVELVDGGCPKLDLDFSKTDAETTRAKIHGLMWIWCAWSLLRHEAPHVELNLKMPKWGDMEPPGWRLAAVAASRGLLHPERYRKYAMTQQHRHIDGHGMAHGPSSVGPRRTGQSWDSCLRAAVAVLDSEVAVIEAHDPRWAEEMRDRALKWLQGMLPPHRPPPPKVIVSWREAERLYQPSARPGNNKGVGCLPVDNPFGLNRPFMVRMFVDHYRRDDAGEAIRNFGG